MKRRHRKQNPTLFFPRHHLLRTSRLLHLLTNTPLATGSTMLRIVGTNPLTMTRMPLNNGIARSVTVVCFLWMLSLPLLGGSSVGKDWFSSLAGHFYDDYKGGVPMIMLAIPLLLAATVSSLLTTTPHHHYGSRGRTSFIMTRTILQQYPVFVQSCYQWFCRPNSTTTFRITDGGDFNFDSFALVFLFLPSLIYLVSSIYRKVIHQDLSSSNQVMEIGNCFGLMGLLAISILLVPVTRQGPLWHALGWHPARAIRMHIWAGRILVLASLFHGFLHMSRWVYWKDTPTATTLRHQLLPPSMCWTTRSDENCDLMWDGCDCYTILRNLYGFVAAMSMLMIGVTSLHSIRRNMYPFFYKAHILLAPIIILTLTMHYNRAILYFAPSLLYYIAGSFPAILESRIKTWWCCIPGSENPTDAIKVLSVAFISTEVSDKNHSAMPQSIRPCVSLTFEATDAAWRRFSPGMHVHLLVPEISNLSHPFSVNRVILHPSKSKATLATLEDSTLCHKNNNDPQQLRIIFRVSGPFTKQLATRLTSTMRFPSLRPRIQLQGYYGNSDHVAQVLQHDVVIIIAGGIGITAYLSLLEELTSIIISDNEQLSRDHEPVTSMVTKKIVLHWMCREPALVNFIHKEYFQPLLRRAVASSSSSSPPPSRAAYRQRCCLGLLVHQTGNNNNNNSFWNDQEETLAPGVFRLYSDAIHHKGATYSEEEESDTRDHPTSVESEPTSPPHFIMGSDGVAFSPSRFSAASKIAGNAGTFLAFSATTWCGLLIVWSLYSNVQHSEQVSQRAIAPLIIVVLGIVSSFIVHYVPQRCCLSEDDNSPIALGGRRYEGEYWDRVERDDEEENDVDDKCGDDLSPSIEMTGLSDSNGGIVEEEQKERQVEQLVTLQVLHGRPDVSSLLRSAADSHRPAVLCCAPSSLSKEVYDRTHAKCPPSKISFYSEAFEI
jgi:ferredoxin-NADP reductase